MQNKIFKISDLYITSLFNVIKEFDPRTGNYKYTLDKTNVKKTIVIYENNYISRVSDIFTNLKYYNGTNELFLSDCVRRNERVFTPKNTIPLADQYYIDKEEISLDELRFYQRDLIDKELLAKRDEIESKYNRIHNDIILMYINNAIDYMDVLNINNESKNKYKQELYNIANNYINEIINLKSGMYKNANNLVTIATIRRKYVSLIIEIEDELFNIETIEIQSLKEDLEGIKFRLK